MATETSLSGDRDIGGHRIIIKIHSPIGYSVFTQALEDIQNNIDEVVGSSGVAIILYCENQTSYLKYSANKQAPSMYLEENTVLVEYFTNLSGNAPTLDLLRGMNKAIRDSLTVPYILKYMAQFNVLMDIDEPIKPASDNGPGDIPK